MSRHRHQSLLAQLGDAKRDLERAKAAYEMLAVRARMELPFGHNVEGDVDVQVVPDREWDKAKGLENYGEQICSPAVDLKLARSVMTGAEFDSYYIERDPKVIVRFLDDPSATVAEGAPERSEA